MVKTWIDKVVILSDGVTGAWSSLSPVHKERREGACSGQTASHTHSFTLTPLLSVDQSIDVWNHHSLKHCRKLKRTQVVHANSTQSGAAAPCRDGCAVLWFTLHTFWLFIFYYCSWFFSDSFCSIKSHIDPFIHWPDTIHLLNQSIHPVTLVKTASGEVWGSVSRPRRWWYGGCRRLVLNHWPPDE